MTLVDLLAGFGGVVLVGFFFGVGLWLAIATCDWIARRFE